MRDIKIKNYFFKPFKERSIFERLTRYLIRVFGVIIFLFVFLYLICQLTSVQNWVGLKLKNWIHDKTGNEVQIDNLRWQFADKIYCANIFIADHHQDTLFQAKSLYVNVNILRRLISTSIILDAIEIKDLRLKIVTYPGEDEKNLDRFIKLLIGKKSNTGSKPTNSFDIKSAKLYNAQFSEVNYNTGKSLNLFIDRAETKIRKLDFVNNSYLFDEIFLQRPIIQITTSNTAKPLNSNKSDKKPSINTTKPIAVQIANYKISDGTFNNLIVDSKKIHPKSGIDFLDIVCSSVQLDGKDFKLSGNSYSAKKLNLKLKEKSGFEIKEFKAGDIAITPNESRLFDFKFKTAQTELGDSLKLSYNSYSDFSNLVDDVRFEYNSKSNVISVKDILYLAPLLGNKEIILRNISRSIKIDGSIRGTVNTLRAKNLKISIDNLLNSELNISLKDVTRKEETSMNLEIMKLRTNMASFNKLIPELKLPKKLQNLGDFTFSGQFEGFLTDFVAFGNIETSLGNAFLDMRMNLNNGPKLAEYSGRFDLQKFNFGSWVNDKNLGIVSANGKIKNGKGFSKEDAYAELDGNIELLEYKSYSYRNIVLSGKFKSQVIDGTIKSVDPNATLDFSGKIDLSLSSPTLDFISSIGKLDLKALNLTKTPNVLSGQLTMNLITPDFRDFEGTIKGDNIVWVGSDNRTTAIERIDVVSTNQGNGKNQLLISSNVLDAKLEGRYTLKTLKDVALSYWQSKHQNWYDKFKMPNSTYISNSSLKARVDIKKSQLLNQFLPASVSIPDNTLLLFNCDYQRELYSFEITAPSFKFKDNIFDKIKIAVNSRNNAASDFFVDLGSYKNGKLNLDSIEIKGGLYLDSLDYEISGLEISNSDLSHKLGLKLENSGYRFNFLNDEFKIVNEIWKINPFNSVYLDDKTISASFFQLNNGSKQINLNNALDRGLEFSLLGVDLNIINQVTGYNKVNLKGDVQFYAHVQDAFSLKNFGFSLACDSVFINKDYWGNLAFSAATEDLKSIIYSEFSLENGNSAIQGRGNLKFEDGITTLSINNKLRDVPLKLIQYIIPSGLSNTFGLINGNVKLEGSSKAISMDGLLNIKNAGFKIDYIGEKYFIDNQDVKLKSTIIDATGAIIKDENGNTAEIQGGIVHDHFKNWGYKVKISSPLFRVLNTKREDNDRFYGKGIGAVNLKIDGSFAQTNMYINAKTAKGSQLTIPFGKVAQATQSRFITFENAKTDSIERIRPKIRSDLKGLNLDMDLTCTEETLMNIILDEAEGDNLKAYGRGNIQIVIARSGDFNMYGDYEIQNGEYLFTLLNIVNKPFLINSGSIVRWTGDTIEAEINLTASYKDLYTSPYNFISEYITNDPQAIAEARNVTKVDLSMNLTGRLLQPNIKLDISFPNVSPLLRNYLDNKLRIVRQDQNEMNRQAMALIVTKTFIPPNAGFSGTQYVSSINTVSELLSNQLSGYITDLFSDIIAPDGIISGIDLDIGYNVFETNTINPFQSSEFQLRQRTSLFNDRLEVNIGGNVGTNTNPAITSNTYLAGDVEFTYALTSDNRLKIRFAQRSQPAIQGGRVNRTSLGLSYRREFDTFDELLSEMRKGVINSKKNK